MSDHLLGSEESYPDPLTFVEVFDLLRAKDGKPPAGDTVSGDELAEYGISILGGCGHCQAQLAAYNGYPSKSGYWSCRECLSDEDGIYSLQDWEKMTVDEFVKACDEAEEIAKLEDNRVVLEHEE